MYNADVRRDFDQTADFIAIHYAFTQRKDTPYWKDCFNRSYDLNQFWHYGMRAYSREMHLSNMYTHPESGFHYVASGMNICPLTEPIHDYVDHVDEWEAAVKQLPTGYEYFTSKYQKE